MEKQPSFSTIIGGNDEQKEILDKKAEEASLRSGAELFGEYLVEPSIKEKNIINSTVEYANEISTSYGSTRKVKTERVFLLKPESVESLSCGEIRSAVCNSYYQSIAVERRTPILLASTIVHECFHLSSYQSAQIFLDGSHGSYRSGIEMMGRNKEGGYFSLAQEAIIATLSRRFFDEVVAKNPVYEKKIEGTERIKEWVISFSKKNMEENQQKKLSDFIQNVLCLPNSDTAIDILYNSSKNDEWKIGYFFGFFDEEFKRGEILQERKEERDKFDEVLNQIISESNGKLTNKEELFDDFARAHFTGNFLPLARKIDGALGKGYFRKMAIELGEIDEGDSE